MKKKHPPKKRLRSNNAARRALIMRQVRWVESLVRGNLIRLITRTERVPWSPEGQRLIQQSITATFNAIQLNKPR